MVIVLIPLFLFQGCLKETKVKVNQSYNIVVLPDNPGCHVPEDIRSSEKPIIPFLKDSKQNEYCWYYFSMDLIDSVRNYNNNLE